MQALGFALILIHFMKSVCVWYVCYVRADSWRSQLLPPSRLVETS